MELTWGETMKDKAGRLMPTAFSELVEQATSELLLSPDYERILALCDYSNAEPERNLDLVRAVRRRIDHKIPKIRYFTIVLVEALIKNCGHATHVELAECKGLLKDMVGIALHSGVGQDLEAEAKTAALQLILNCSFWFRPEAIQGDEKVKVLGELASFVLKAQAIAFTGMEPDKTVVINRAAVRPPKAAPARNASSKARAQRQQQQQQPRGPRPPAAGGADGAPADNRRFAGQVVDAIPLISPTEEELSGMMDAVMLLGEALTTAEEQHTQPQDDEVVKAIVSEVKSHHRRLATLVSSGAELPNMEVLLSICDSQIAVVQRYGALSRGQHTAEEEHHQVPAHGTTSTEQHLPSAEQHGHPSSSSDVPSAHPPPPGYTPAYAAPSVTTPEPGTTGTHNNAMPVLRDGAPDIDELMDPMLSNPHGATVAMVAPIEPVHAGHHEDHRLASDQEPHHEQVSVPTVEPVLPTYQAAPPAPPQHEGHHQYTAGSPAAVVPPPPAPTIDDLFGDVRPEPQPAPVRENGASPKIRAASDIDAHHPAPAVYSHGAFPQPHQQMDPSQVHPSEEEQVQAQQHSSLNGDQEFDAFLNNRLGS